MFTAAAVEQGNVVTSGLEVWFDFADTSCFRPTEGTGSITAGTLFYNLAPGGSAVSGSINGAVNWSSAFGGCLNLTNGSTSELKYTGGLSASFTVQTIVTSGTDASPNANWGTDLGGWPGARLGNNGFVWAQQFAASPGNYLIPILWYGASVAVPNLPQPINGYNAYTFFPNVYTFKTNGSNSHSTYMNTGFKTTNTTTYTRGNSSVGSIYLNFDSAVSNRHGTGRLVAYLLYNRTLEDSEIFQNAQYYLNRFGVK